MNQFATVLNADELAQLHAMAERIRTTRPDERSGQMQVHHAVEDAISGLICIGQGNPSCSNDFTQIGKSIRDAVIRG